MLRFYIVIRPINEYMVKPRFIFVDTETTGISFKRDRVTELAFLCENYVFDEFIKIPEDVEYPEEVQSMTGIRRGVLDMLGQNERDCAEIMYDFLAKSENTIFVAHNAQFDVSFIKGMLERNGFELPKIHYIDTLTVAREKFPYPHKLCNLIEYFGIEDVQNSHRAIDDVKALKAVFSAMIKAGVDMNEFIDKFAYSKKYGLSGDKLDGIEYYPL